MLLLAIAGVVDVYQCADARETVIAPHLPALKMLPGALDLLAQLDRAFYLVWVSPWGDAINYEAATSWGLDPRPWIAAAGDQTVEAVAQALRDWHGALAWVQAGFSQAAREWASDRLRTGARTWLVDVAESGLTAQVTADLVAWAGV